MSKFFEWRVVLRFLKPFFISRFIVYFCFVFLAKSSGAFPDASIQSFESGDFSGWDVKRLVAGYSAQVTPKRARDGKLSARFELREKDYTHNGFRAEIRDPYNAPEGAEVYYWFSTFVPLSAKFTEENRCVFAQWHDQDSSLGKPTHVHSPPLSIALKKNTYKIKLCNSDEQGICKKSVLFKEKKFEFGKWYDFTFKIKWSAKSDGWIEAWANGERIVDYKGRVGNPKFADPLDNVGVHVKLGIYCASGPKEPLVLTHDNYGRMRLN